MRYSRRERQRRLRNRVLLGGGLVGTAGLMIGNPLLSAAAPATRSPKARSVIQIWMWGGPSHLDTFDPKPEAGYDYCGSLSKPIGTSSGARIGELLPLLAKEADKYSILRGMTHGVNGHETASYMVQTGHPAGERIVYPCVGAVVSGRHRGQEQHPKRTPQVAGLASGRNSGLGQPSHQVVVPR